MKTKFPERLKELREDVGLGQDALGRAIGVSKGTISLWENGLRDPKLSNLIRLAKFFDVSLDYLAGLED
ncbi:MAG: helix-turn-helix transcriptional regulator [Clostridia bacterium]|nr:helix-turn-helix transcriptional regulator [Clostridia bacterium]